VVEAPPARPSCWAKLPDALVAVSAHSGICCRLRNCTYWLGAEPWRPRL